MTLSPEQPPSGRAARLRVVQDPVPRKVQDCGVCQNQRNCFAPGIKEEHIVSNMLVCRIKRGINVDRSVKLLLQMLRPVLKKHARIAVKGTKIDVETALADLESETIFKLQNKYVMGERAYPLHWLFGAPNGHIRRYAFNYLAKERDYTKATILKEPEKVVLDGPDESWTDEVDTETEITKAARKIIDDGITLSLPEYRVVSFCLANASDQKRPLNGLHVYLGKKLDVVRARVTRIWSDGMAKVVEEARRSH